jgi:periodic tryptophan protein 1
MISATRWVPRGFAAEFPTKYDFNDEEMERISGLAKLQLQDAREALADAQAEDQEDGEGQQDDNENSKPQISTLKDDSDDELKEYDLDHYDDDDGEGQGQNMGMFNNIKSLAYYEPGEKDPYITLPNADDEDEDRQELQILSTDNLILATKTEDDVSILEVYVYNDNVTATESADESTLYVHHDLMLPSFPLCVEWLDYRVGKGKLEEANAPGNFAAIGTFEPEIEIWNLDVVDSVYPDLILGQRPDGADLNADDGSNQKTKKKKKRQLAKKINNQYHVDAVLSLSANRLHRNLLTSGSADTTVKLWDVNNGTCVKSFQFHEGKVSSVAWNPKEGTVLLSGGYDGYAVVSDLRIQDVEQGRRKWHVHGDIEGTKWGSDGNEFYVSTEHGRIHKFDARQESRCLWTLQAHDADVTSFDVNNFVDGYMVTASTDKTTKLWNLSSSSGPSLILSRDLDVGRVFSVGFAPDREAFGRVVVAGGSGTVKVWDTMTNRTVRNSIGSRATWAAKQGKEDVVERLVGVADDNEREDDEDDQQEGAIEPVDSDEEL